MQNKTKMYMEYYRLLEKWMQNIENKKTIKSYFKYNNYKNIALYGMGKMAKHVIKELVDSDITVVYAIDQNTMIDNEIEIIPVDTSSFPFADVLIVTPVYDYEDIERKMSKILDIPIVSLKEVIDETGIL